MTEHIIILAQRLSVPEIIILMMLILSYSLLAYRLMVVIARRENSICRNKSNENQIHISNEFENISREFKLLIKSIDSLTGSLLSITDEQKRQSEELHKINLKLKTNEDFDLRISKQISDHKDKFH